MKKHKICIAGGGLTGLISALILSNKGLDVDFIAEDNRTKVKDIRVTAISEKNLEFLKSNLKNLNLKLFYPVKKINLFFEKDNKISNFLNFDEENNLMYFFENNPFKEVLTKLLKKSNIKIINQTIKSINIDTNIITTNKFVKSYDLIILCLGSKSPLYQKISGNREIKKDYKEHSITCSVKHKIKQDVSAKQFFLKEGPLAILPFKKNEFSVVWSLENIFYKSYQKNLNIRLKSKIANLLNIEKFSIGKIQSYPLKLSLKRNYYKKNTIILGDGLHVVHPLAGQGFNLILRDIKIIVDLICYNLQLGLSIKDSNIPKKFADNRKPENILLGLGIDTTRQFFKSNKYLDPLKEDILNNFSKFKILKRITKRVANIGLN